MKKRINHWASMVALSAICASAFWGCAQHTAMSGAEVPRYEVDPLWTKAMPDNWIYGQVSSVAVDGRDHVYVLHRPRTLHADEKGRTQNPPANRCCLAAPPVVEYDANGNVVRAWGGPAQNNEPYDWPAQEHGIHVDAQGHVWISGNDAKDHHLLKFTREGKFLLQIGKPGKSEGSNSPTQLGSPAAIESDAAANEIYVGDGYTNKRVIVFDATTGAYKRHWGAYGARPDDAKQPPYKPGAAPSKQFGNPHCVRRSRDGLIYVCDRPNNRIQVFEGSGKFLRNDARTPVMVAAGAGRKDADDFARVFVLGGHRHTEYPATKNRHTAAREQCQRALLSSEKGHGLRERGFSAPASPQHKPLHPPPKPRLGGVEITFGVNRDVMQVAELARLATGAPEGAELAAILACEDVNLGIRTVGHHQKALRGIA